jgi:site-specific recombinase XerC
MLQAGSRNRAGLSRPHGQQRLAAIPHLFDWLVVGQILPFNPASSVRGPA